MNSETKQCQNCKNQFIIEPDDFAFYEKIKVPPPTWCVECRLRRRLLWRNERSLHHRTCDAPGHGESIISMYAPDAPVKVYDHKFWWSDAWSAKDYGRDFVEAQPFFKQWKQLMSDVPFPSLNVLNVVDADYTNYGTNLKNCYLTFGGDFSENCLYSTFNFYSKESAELYFVDHCELCYECVDTNNAYQVMYSRYVNHCSQSAFLYNCSNCTSCVGCVNLQNKSYCIFNEQFTKEEYVKKLKELHFETHQGREEFAKRFKDFALQYPHRYAQVLKSVESTGDSLVNTKNCSNCFDITGPAEDCKDVFLAGWGLKDTRGTSHAGHNTETVFDSWGIFSGSSRVAYSHFIASSYDVTYSYLCNSSHDLFGCIGLRNASYCILNKQYTKEEYGDLREKIIGQMRAVPYVDKAGRSYYFGEFFPAEFSPFPYNQSVAQEYFPAKKNEVEREGLRWVDMTERTNNSTKQATSLPNSIAETNDSVLHEVFECEHVGQCNELCTTVFRIVPMELALYRRLNIPPPKLCSNCRHYQRFRQRNPIRLWHRACMCNGQIANGKSQIVYENTAKHFHGEEKCLNEFETSYAPERPEIVYCEQCYNSEVA